jgi:hypothetical protein
MFGKPIDPLQEALNSKKTSRLSYKLAETQSNFFKTSKLDLEYFGMSFTQRIFSFIISLVLGVLLFLVAMYRLIFGAVFRPTGFVPPYLISNICFFFMFGFVSGFRTFFTKLFKSSKRNFSIAFLSTTVLTLYAALFFKSKIVIFLFGIMQIVSFSVFIITFLPGGTSGITSLINMFIKG